MISSIMKSIIFPLFVFLNFGLFGQDNIDSTYTQSSLYYYNDAKFEITSLSWNLAEINIDKALKISPFDIEFKLLKIDILLGKDDFKRAFLYLDQELKNQLNVATM